MKIPLIMVATLLLAFGAVAQPYGAKPAPGLANATVLIVRHAEKPSAGDGLAPQGEARAKAYARYFRSLSLDGARVRIDALIATADSAGSRRPRLTLEPLGHVLNLPIEQPFEDHEVAKLADWLGRGAPNRTILIAWHHGEIPDLLSALGVDPAVILSGGRWPDKVYDWLVVVKYDRDGRVVPGSVRLVRQPIGLVTAASQSP